MRLKQKQFIPFMIVVAVITLAIIVWSSFNFNKKKTQRFEKSIASADSLLIIPLAVVGEADSITIQSQKSKYTILVFWASWSEKSILLMDEIQQFEAETDSVAVIAALVKDAEESLSEKKKYPRFIYVDGIKLFNELRVPGFPSYVLFDEDGNQLHAHVGYQKGAGYEILKSYLNE